MATSIQKVTLDPVNRPNSGIYAYSNGSPVISFEIAQSPTMLICKSIRVQGKLRINRPNSTDATPLLPDNNDNKGSGLFDVKFNPRVGVNSIIDQISINSAWDHQSLETIRSYPRYLASVLPAIYSRSDFDTYEQLESLTASNQLAGDNLVNNDVDFSIPLRCGLFSGVDMLPMGMNGFRGLIVNLSLSPDSQSLFGGDASGCFVQVIEPELVFDLFSPPDEDQQKMSAPSSGSFVYNSIQHLYSTLSSSDQTVNLSLGASKVLSVLHNFNDTSSQNNYSSDSMETKKLTGLEKVSFQRGGILFPRENPIAVGEQTSQGRPEGELLQTYMDSIKPFYATNHTLVSPITEIALEESLNAIGGNEASASLPDTKSASGIGIKVDPLGVGLSYKNTPYSIRLESSSSYPTQQSMYTFVKAQNVLNYTPQGIQVVS